MKPPACGRRGHPDDRLIPGAVRRSSRRIGGRRTRGRSRPSEATGPVPGGGPCRLSSSAEGVVEGGVLGAVSLSWDPLQVKPSAFVLKVTEAVVSLAVERRGDDWAVV